MQLAVAAPTTPAVLPTPAGSIQDYWEDGKAAYEDRDWASALSYLTLVRRIDPGFQRAHACGHDGRRPPGPGGGGGRRRRPDRRTRPPGRSGRAAPRRPADRPPAGHGGGVGGADRPDRPDRAQDTPTGVGGPGRGFAAGGNYCSAVEQLQAATAVLPNLDALDRLREYGAACAQVRAEATAQAQLATLAGRILYSTQVGPGYQVLVAPARAEARSTLVIDDVPSRARSAAGHPDRLPQPPPWRNRHLGLRPGGPWGARRAGAAHHRRTRGRPGRAPSWAPDDRDLAYSSTRVGDRRPRSS